MKKSQESSRRPLDTTVHDHPRRARPTTSSADRPHEHRHDAIERGFGVGAIAREHEVDRDERDVPPDRQTDEAPHAEHEPQELGEPGRRDGGDADLDRCRPPTPSGGAPARRADRRPRARFAGSAAPTVPAALSPLAEVDVDLDRRGLRRGRNELDGRDHGDEDRHTPTSDEHEARSRRRTRPARRASTPAATISAPATSSTPYCRGAGGVARRTARRRDRSFGSVRSAFVLTRPASTINRARKLTTNVRRNSARPAATSPLRSSDVGLAEVDRDVRRDRRRTALQHVRCSPATSGDEITIATAIVSPSARPNPSSARADDPAAGERQDDVADHPPTVRRARARPRTARAGTCAITSRDTDVMIGSDHERDDDPGDEARPDERVAVVGAAGTERPRGGSR